MELIMPLFNIYNFYVLFSVILYELVIDKEKILGLGGENIYLALHKSEEKLKILFQNKDIWNSMEGIQQGMKKVGGYSLLLLFICGAIPFLNFLITPMVFIILFIIYFLMSYEWVIQPDSEIKI